MGLIAADLMQILTAALQRAWASAHDKVDTYIIANGPSFAAKLVNAVLIFYVGKWGAKVAEKLLGQVLASAKVEETLAKFLCRITYAFMLCAVVLASLEKLGVNTTSVTAVLAAAGLAIGMALQGSLSNFAAGVMIILFRPFKVGDSVEAAGTKGIVEEINVFSTLMRTPDNVEIVVPNSAITSGNITNYSSKPTRRIDMVVSCGYKDDLLAVRRFLEGLLRDDPRVLRDPAPVVAVHELADHSVNFVVRPWVKNADYWDVRWSLTERIKLGFDAQGFEIPFPQRDVHVYSEVVASGDALAQERIRDRASATPALAPQFSPINAAAMALGGGGTSRPLVDSPINDSSLIRPRRVA